MAAELAGWQDLHEKMGRKAIKDLARSMLIRERATLEGLRRAVRRLKVGERNIGGGVEDESEDEDVGVEREAGGSTSTNAGDGENIAM